MHENSYDNSVSYIQKGRIKYVFLKDMECKAMVFPVVVYGRESYSHVWMWELKKA